MAFVTLPGITGKVFIPEAYRMTAGKNACSDCFSCQQCGDGRCALCLASKGRGAVALRVCSAGRCAPSAKEVSHEQDQLQR